VTYTHHLVVDQGRVTKRYVSWSRGEHVREWTVLRRVYARCPDLVPEPLAADLDADPPFVTMSVVPGSPLTGAVDGEQQAALYESLRRLWSVPAVDLPARRHHPAEIHALMTTRMDGLDLPALAGDAARAARTFLARLRLGPAGSTVLVTPTRTLPTTSGTGSGAGSSTSKTPDAPTPSSNWPTWSNTSPPGTPTGPDSSRCSTSTPTGC
jgi:hypothetical protein